MGWLSSSKPVDRSRMDMAKCYTYDGCEEISGKRTGQPRETQEWFGGIRMLCSPRRTETTMKVLRTRPLAGKINHPFGLTH